MHTVDKSNSTGRLIPVDRSFLRIHGRQETESRIRRIVRSVRFELLEQEGAIRILGPDTGYHRADPYLIQGLDSFAKGLGLNDIGSYRSDKGLYDLCLEDSWSGCFIAGRLDGYQAQDDVVLIHLDDHTDMMPTLLSPSGHGLVDPVSGRGFDPSVQEDWVAAINTGSIGIGSFVTPLFYTDHKLHVRHLNNYTTSAYRIYNVTHDSRCHGLLPGREFALIRKKNSDWQNSAGTYRGGQDPDRVLEGMPDGRIIVHIDLDYFINDFNGNTGASPSLSAAQSRNIAGRKLERFTESLRAVTTSVDRWIIATSPGFCSARHWGWLLSRIEEKIELFNPARQGVNGA